MAIGTPFSGDMCEKCECTPCKCTTFIPRWDVNPENTLDIHNLTPDEIQYLMEKWKNVPEFNNFEESDEEQIHKLQNAKIIQSKEFWEAEINNHKNRS